MSQDSKTARKKESRGLLRRFLKRSDVQKASTPKLREGGTSPLVLEDIQGLILRGYRMPLVRHFLLKVNVAAAARKALGRLVSGDAADAPQITTSKEWRVGFEPGPFDDQAEAPHYKPDYCLNVGITWPGLLALELKDRIPNLSFKSFKAFVLGAAARAEIGRRDYTWRGNATRVAKLQP